ncbi:hypothetical protein [Streptomyces sp. NPDC050388]|uniref:hypothetical protein n=1 Tax=Streptomyces sp. NPDC050388 TaxID=3155781 RepID=UPI00341C24C4
MDREVQAVHVREEVFDAGEGGAELGDQLGQVGDEPAALAGPRRSGVGDDVREATRVLQAFEHHPYRRHHRDHG